MKLLQNNKNVPIAILFLLIPLVITLASVITKDVRHITSYFMYIAIFTTTTLLSFWGVKKLLKHKPYSSKVNAILAITSMSMIKYGLIAMGLILSFVFSKQLSWEVGIFLIALYPLFIFSFKSREDN